MTRSNCFVFAWWLWAVRYRFRGYCAIRLTRPPLRCGWHWVYVPPGRRLRTIHYEPIERQTVWWRAAIHKLWYRGRIRRYDTEWRARH